MTNYVAGGQNMLYCAKCGHWPPTLEGLPDESDCTECGETMIFITLHALRHIKALSSKLDRYRKFVRSACDQIPRWLDGDLSGVDSWLDCAGDDPPRLFPYTHWRGHRVEPMDEPPK